MGTIIGVIIVVVAATLLVGMTLWARARINSLGEQGFPSAREADQEKEDV
jgi:hypothetical protein